MLGFLFLFKFTEELLTLFFRDGSLSLKLGTLFLELLANSELVLLKSVLHLGHLLFIDGHDNIRGHFTSRHGTTRSTALHIELTATKSSELLSQTCDLVVELPDHSVLGILIDARLILDVLGTGSISKGRKCLIDIVISRAQVCNHHCLCVASKRVLQDTSKLGVTIGNVRALGIGE